MNTCEQYEVLITGYLDGELTQGDRQRVEVHVDSCPRCRKTYEKMKELCDDVGKLSFGEMPPEEWSEIMNDVSVRASHGIGWFLYLAGIAVLVGYAGFEFYRDDTVPALIKTGVAAVILGMGLMLLSVLRHRMIVAKSDKYEDVQI